MNFFLITSFLFLFNPVVKAEGFDSNHAKCLKASDYEGCMDFQQNKNKPATYKKKNNCIDEWCNPREIGQQTDNLGMKIIPNFWFLEDPVKRVAFYNDLSNLYQVKAKGEYGRFFHHRIIYRYYSKGYSGYSSLSGGGDTNCFSYGSSIDCTTTMPNLVTIPGKYPGVEQVNDDLIYDCLDNTTAVYWDNKLRKVPDKDGKKRKWHKWGSRNYLLEPYQKDRIWKLEKVCNGEVLTSPRVSISSFSKFEKKIPRKRNYSDKKNVGNINCNSPVWRDKARCN